MSIFHLSAPSRPPSLNLSSSPFDQTGQKTALSQEDCDAAREHSRPASTSVIDFPPSCDHSLFVTFSCRLFNTLQPNQFHIFVNALQLGWARWEGTWHDLGCQFPGNGFICRSYRAFIAGTKFFCFFFVRVCFQRHISWVIGRHTLALRAISL